MFTYNLAFCIFKLTGLSLPGYYLLPFLKIAEIITFFLSFGTSPLVKELINELMAMYYLFPYLISLVYLLRQS